MDTSQESRETRLEQLLLSLGGVAQAKLMAIERKEDSQAFLDVLDRKQLDFYERIKRVSYGLPEEKQGRDSAE